MEANISVNDIFDFERRLYPGLGLSGVGFGGKIRARPVVPNTLYWPTGASNFAVGYFFCTGTQKAEITQAVYGGSPTLIPVPPAPTLTVVGTGGTTPYDYAIASFGPTGDSSGPSTIATINANVTLDINNYVNIAWTAISGAWGYRVLKWDGANYNLLATVGANVLTFNDQGQPTSPYRSPTSYRYKSQPLELSQYDQSDTLKNVVLTNMYLLPPRPLTQIFNEQGDQLYLLCLVDERYFWWEKSTYDMLFQVGATWNDVWTWLSGCLGTAITVDTIPTTYPAPDRAIVAPYEYLALVLDAVAYILGQKIIRYFDGTVRSANVLPEETAEQLEIATLRPVPNQRAGGQLTIDPLIVPNDMNALVPASVTFVFQASVAGTVTDGIYVIEIFLNTLGLPEFSGIMGHAGSKVFKARYLATFTTANDSTPTNQTILLAYAQQFATDWYRWRIGQLDAVWQGTPAGVIEGLTDDIEYTYAGDQVSCRVQRGTWMDLTDDLVEAKLGATAAPPSVTVGQNYAYLYGSQAINIPIVGVFDYPTALLFPSFSDLANTQPPTGFGVYSYEGTAGNWDRILLTPANGMLLIGGNVIFRTSGTGFVDLEIHDGLFPPSASSVLASTSLYVFPLTAKYISMNVTAIRAIGSAGGWYLAIRNRTDAVLNMDNLPTETRCNLWVTMPLQPVI